MNTAHATNPRTARRSLFPEFITAGRPAAADRLRQRADRLDKRAQIAADIEAIETAAADRWNGEPTDHQARRLRALAARYAERAVTCKTLRALAALHDRFDLPSPLLSITTERHVATLTAPDPVAAEQETPLGRALAWRTMTGARRADAVRDMADLLARLDIRTGPLPLAVARHLDDDAPDDPQLPPPAPLAHAFETWAEAVEAASRPHFDDETGLVSRFASIPWREGYDLGLSPKGAADHVFAWIVARTVRGVGPFAWHSQQERGEADAPQPLS